MYYFALFNIMHCEQTESDIFQNNSIVENIYTYIYETLKKLIK